MKTVISLEATLESTSSLTGANVADLQAIHDRMQTLTERAENILRGSKEVFPAAQSGWLRRIKSALGMLSVKDCHTLEDTLQYCYRLVSINSMDQKIVDPLSWAKSEGFSLKYRNKLLTNITSKVVLISVYKSGVFTGTLSRYGGSWLFIRAQVDFPENIDFSKSDLKL